MPLLQKNSAKLKQLASRAGLAKQLDLKVVEYFDFYPTAEGFRGIKEREEFAHGPNSDYLYSLFHVIQKTGNDRVLPSLRNSLTSRQLENPQLVQELIGKLEAGEPIEGRLSPTHYGVPRANFTKDELEAALGKQCRTASGSRGYEA